jgi:hypothetical protein
MTEPIERPTAERMQELREGAEPTNREALEMQAEWLERRAETLRSERTLRVVEQFEEAGWSWNGDSFFVFEERDGQPPFHHECQWSVGSFEEDVEDGRPVVKISSDSANPISVVGIPTPYQVDKLYRLSAEVRVDLGTGEGLMLLELGDEYFDQDIEVDLN